MLFCAPMSQVLDLIDWAENQKLDWEGYARTKYRDYFVASHRGWDDRKRWKAQAVFDAAIVVHELDPERLAGFEVLEIGCGVGRLAEVIAPKVKGYTGIDIAPGMIEEVRTRCGNLGNARFFLGDGLSIPPPACDRRYDLVFAFAVFIHCPRDVVGSLVRSALSLLAPGGELRFQLRADSSDPAGIRPSAEAPIDVAPPPLDAAGPTEEELQALLDVENATRGRPFMGDLYRYDEVGPFLRSISPGSQQRLYRFDPEHIYVDLIRA